MLILQHCSNDRQPVLDFTSVHVHFRHGPHDKNHKQVCFGPPGRKIHFAQYENSFLAIHRNQMYDGVFKVDWPTGTYPYAFGAFVCSVHESILSSATSLAMARLDAACKPYHFGQHCSHNCTEVAVVAGGGDARCGGMLFCLPDPYGCSCYPGFSGIDCTSTCSKGTYGANCKQNRTCHCQPDDGCHPQFGVCSQPACEEGYRDEPYCDETASIILSSSMENLLRELAEKQPVMNDQSCIG
ncbi:hypothetical protein HPB48_023779 [Haemaphysalis longicornis]|uniref:EGF-like domain-containing protein n=1 Tax=Haemaphysalis longicornis TaxID=44386 RepID=A0A9J6H7F4_HAELO|nr:hypothetical protein HPB48_023779 [Haemaphysalis longicornis]